MTNGKTKKDKAGEAGREREGSGWFMVIRMDGKGNEWWVCE